MSVSPRIALVAGATGLVGSQLLPRLLADDRYERITALVRRPLALAHPKLQERLIDFGRLEQELETVEADDWFCTLGTTIKQAGTREAFRQVDYEYPLALGRRAAASAGQQFLVVTAMGTSVRSRFFYSRVKGELERDLSALQLPTLHIFRPSLLLGERQEYRLGERAGALLMKALSPLLAGPLRKYQGIEADTVAQGMLSAARQRSAPGVYIYESDRIGELSAPSHE